METPTKTTLRATAKTFTFSPAAAVWTPQKIAVPGNNQEEPSPKPVSALKPTAKAFVPTFSPQVMKQQQHSSLPQETLMTKTSTTVKSVDVNVKINFTVHQEDKENQLPESAVDSMETLVSKEKVQSPEEEEEEKEVEAITTDTDVDATVALALEHLKNADGRYQYSPEVFLRMRPAPSACSIPECLLHCPCASSSSTSSSSSTLGSSSHRSNSNHHHHQHHHHHKSSNSRKPQQQQQQRRNHHHHRRSNDTAPALEDCKPLEINEATRWKAKKTLSTEQDDDIKINKGRSILNKLSMEKFDKLSDAFIDIALFSETVLSQCIKCIMEKAQMEWHFSFMYAQLCCKLAYQAQLEQPNDEDKVHKKMFRKLLLTQCQKQFEQDDRENDDETPDEDAEAKLKAKRKTLGHIRFIGELFKQRMLSSRIMHECIHRLFRKLEQDLHDEESLECLCQLLTTIGKPLEEPVLVRHVPLTTKLREEKHMLAMYYDTLREWTTSRKHLCTRLKFRIQDLLELRASNWIARRKEEQAMTIAQVHAQVAREEAKHSGKHGKKMTLPRSNSLNSEWETVPVRSSHYRQQQQQHSTSRSSSSSSSSSFSHTNNGSSNSSSSSSSTSVRRKLKQVTLKKSCHHGMTMESSTAAVPPPERRSTSMTTELVERKVRGMLKELCSIQDLTEAQVVIFELAELAPDLAHTISHHVIAFGLNHGGATEQRLIGQALVRALTCETPRVYSKLLVFQGLEDTMECLDDLEVDIPHVLKYLGVMLAPLVLLPGVLDSFLSHFHALLELNREKSQTLIEHMVKEMQHLHLNTSDDEALAGEWKSSFESKGWKVEL